MTYICVCLGLAEDLEARVLKRKLRAAHRERRRSMQDGRRGLQRQRGRDGGCGANRFRRKTRGVFINSSKAIFKKISQA